MHYNANKTQSKLYTAGNGENSTKYNDEHGKVVTKMKFKF